LKLAKFLNSIGYNPLQADPAVFVHKSKSKWFYTHVDDLIHMAPRGEGAEDMQRVFKTFPGKYFGEAHNPLGISIESDRKARTISIAQPRPVEGALARFGQERSTPRDYPLPEGGKLTSDRIPLSKEEAAEYPAITGTLMYIMTVSRPDLCFTASTPANFIL
jgi:hypothetical protein